MTASAAIPCALTFAQTKMKNESGIYFEESDYAGFVRRLAIIGIDLFVYWAALILIETALKSAQFEEITHAKLSLLSIGIFGFLYSIEMKRRIGSLGNLLTRTKLVSIYGKRPSLISMIVRFAFIALGPIMLVIDLIWMTSENTKQMIRDIYGGVYVVKSQAKPSGSGTIRFTNCFFLGYSWMLRKVMPDKDGEQVAAGNDC